MVASSSPAEVWSSALSRNCRCCCCCFRESLPWIHDSPRSLEHSTSTHSKIEPITTRISNFPPKMLNQTARIWLKVERIAISRNCICATRKLKLVIKSSWNDSEHEKVEKPDIREGEKRLEMEIQMWWQEFSVCGISLERGSQNRIQILSGVFFQRRMLFLSLYLNAKLESRNLCAVCPCIYIRT